MTTDTDVLILGGGCAGLSLAVALAQHAPHLRVTTLEARQSYSRDRTWCFWNTAEHPFGKGITHSWQQWRVRNGNQEIRRASRRFCYQHLSADGFYGLAQQAIHAADQRLLLNTQAGETAFRGHVYETQTSAGALRSGWVFDARTPAAQTVVPLVWQRFLGWHIKTDEPCFDPTCVDLMDFESPGEDGKEQRIAFFYTLPFSRFEALVEITYLDAAEIPAQDGRARLAERLATLCGSSGYRILFEESGAIPMGLAGPSKAMHGGAIPIGTRGGRVKPSSGYAFQRIQRQSRMLAQALGRGHALPTQFEPQSYAWLDRVFLAALRRHPERAPSYFLELFRGVHPDLLVPFLSETAGTRAMISTMLALPTRDFAAAALLPGVRLPQ